VTEEAPPSPLPFNKAANQIAAALKIEYDAALALLYGLCATDRIRWWDDGRKVVDRDKVTIAKFSGKPLFVSAEDIDQVLSEWSDKGRLGKREAVIEKLLKGGHVPGVNMPWKTFQAIVQEECKAKPGTRGFELKTIQRDVKRLRGR
jgi:hypothetical protein